MKLNERKREKSKAIIWNNESVINDNENNEMIMKKK